MSEKDKPSPDVEESITEGPNVYSAEPQDLPTISSDEAPQSTPETPTDTSDSSADADDV